MSLIAGTNIAKIVANIPQDEYYRRLLKGISICFGILKATFSGGYVNFGVFNLYGDQSLDHVLDMFIKLLTLIPQSDLLVK